MTAIETQCETHGVLPGLMFNNRKPRCGKCIEAEIAERKVKQEEANRLEMIERRAQWADEAVPARYRSASLRDFSELVTSKIRAWIANSSRLNDQLLILGTVGTGKTHLACAITRALIEGGTNSKFSSQANYLREIRHTWDSDTSEDSVFRSFVQPRVLVLDDIGAARGNDNDTLRLGELIAERYDAMRPSVYVTNLTPEQLKSSVGDRSYDRMRDQAIQIVLNGQSRRSPSA